MSTLVRSKEEKDLAVRETLEPTSKNPNLAHQLSWVRCTWKPQGIAYSTAIEFSFFSRHLYISASSYTYSPNQDWENTIIAPTKRKLYKFNVKPSNNVDIFLNPNRCALESITTFAHPRLFHQEFSLHRVVSQYLYTLIISSTSSDCFIKNPFLRNLIFFLPTCISLRRCTSSSALQAKSDQRPRAA